MDLGETFDKSKAFAGTYTSYTIQAYATPGTCYAAWGISDPSANLPNFLINYDPNTGVSTKNCFAATGGGTIGCNAGKW